MEIIALDSNLKEKYPLQIDVDFEVGDSSARNDFEIITTEQKEYAVYIPETEFGGILEYESNPGNNAESTYRAFTWRGLLSQWIIEPERGSDYKIVSGEGNNVLRELLSDVLGGFFIVPNVNSGLMIENYQFELHVSVLKGVMDMLAEYGYKLIVYAKRTGPGEPIGVFCEVAPAQKIEGVYDEDTRLSLTFTDNKMGINHLICWGKGELKDRQRLDLYLDQNGKISETQYYKGFQERQAVFDYGNAESLADLRKHGKERLREIASGKKLQIDEVGDVDLDIGDIVSGRKNDIGMIIEKPIVRKILRISGGTESIEYKVKGEG